MISFRPYNNKDLDEVLELIKRSDSTDRSKETWVGNDMTAMLAYDEDRLIGIIPFEKRNIIMDGWHNVKALWVSAAHVEPEYRGQGVGTQLDNRIKVEFYPEFKAVFVIREDEQSAAYRWYKKLGYHHLANLLSLKLGVTSVKNSTGFVLLETFEEFKNYGPRLKRCFDAHIGSCGGYPERDKRFWENKFNSHYYKEHYTYKILAISGKLGAQIAAYAFCGKTNLRDGVNRLDILEIIVPEDKKVRDGLLSAVLNCADRMHCQEIRIQLAEHDPLVKWLKDCGFVLRWQTNLLGKYIDSGKQFPNVNWKFFHIDYM